MKTKIYLVADRRGVCRMTKRVPDMYRGEIAVRLAIEIPDECFANPFINAELSVPEESVIQPMVEVAVDEPEASSDKLPQAMPLVD